MATPNDLDVNTTTVTPGRLEIAADDAPTFAGNTVISSGDVQVDAVYQVNLGGLNAGVDQFQLSYNNGFQGGSSANLPYTGTSADAVSIANALISLLMAAPFNLSALIASADVVVLPSTIFPNTFNVALLGVAGVDLGVITGSPVAPAVAPVPVGLVNDINNVLLSGAAPAPAAKLSGTGFVGTVTTTAVGTVDPGANGLTSNTGVLSTGNVTWNANTTFFVDLTHNSAPGTPEPIAGIDFDQVNVQGNVTLGNALLTGSILPGIAIPQTLTILTATGTVTSPVPATGVVPASPLDGNIAGVIAPIPQDGSVFIDGQKFTLTYTLNSVVLTRQFNNATVVLSVAPPSPSIYGQDLVYTATVTPEPGVNVIPLGTEVQFSVDGVNVGAPVVESNPAGVAVFSPTFDPQVVLGAAWAPGSAHMVGATFIDPNIPESFISPIAATPLTQSISKAGVNIAITSNPLVSLTTPVYGAPVTITATITSVINPTLGAAPTGNASLYLDTADTGAGIAPNTFVGGVATWILPANLAAGTHAIEVLYLGDSNYNATPLATPGQFTLPIQSDHSVVTITATDGFPLARPPRPRWAKRSVSRPPWRRPSPGRSAFPPAR